MGFDAQKYLKEAQAGQPASGTQSGFDATSYLQSNGVQTLPQAGSLPAPSEAAKAYEAAAPIAAKGLFPGGQFAAPAIESMAGAVDQTVNGQNAFGDQSAPQDGILSRATDALLNMPKNFERANKTQQEKIDQVEADHPVYSALGELVSSVPFAIITGNALGELGLASNAAKAALIGGGYSFANSKNSGLDRLYDATKGGFLSAAISEAPGLISKGLKSLKNLPYEEYLNYDTAKPELDKLSPDNVGIKASPRPNGDFDIKFGGNLKDAVTLGAEQGKMLTSPEVQANVTDEVNNVFGSDQRPGKIPQLIQQTRKDLGSVRDPILDQIGNNPSKSESLLTKVWDKTKSIDTGGDLDADRALENWNARLQDIEANLRTKSPSQSLDDTPINAVFDQKQKLGDALFGPGGIYRKAGAVRSAALDLYHGLNKVLNTSDKSGQMQVLNDAFHATYQMEENAINSPEKLKALTSPLSSTARQAYKDFIEPFMKLDPNVRASLMPDLQEYLATDLPKTLNKAAVIKAVTNNSDSAGGLGWLMNKLYLNKSTAYKTAGAAGALGSVQMPDTSNLASGFSALQQSPVFQGAVPGGALQLLK